jgi:hypothetical protein
MASIRISICNGSSAACQSFCTSRLCRPCYEPWSLPCWCVFRSEVRSISTCVSLSIIVIVLHWHCHAIYNLSPDCFPSEFFGNEGNGFITLIVPRSTSTTTWFGTIFLPLIHNWLFATSDLRLSHANSVQVTTKRERRRTTNIRYGRGCNGDMIIFAMVTPSNQINSSSDNLAIRWPCMAPAVDLSFCEILWCGVLHNIFVSCRLKLPCT